MQSMHSEILTIHRLSWIFSCSKSALSLSLRPSEASVLKDNMSPSLRPTLTPFWDQAGSHSKPQQQLACRMRAPWRSTHLQDLAVSSRS